MPLCISPARSICSFSLLLSPICAFPFVANASTLTVRSADASPCSICSVVFVCSCFANSAEFIPSLSGTYVLTQNEGGAEVTWQITVWNRHCPCLPATQTTMGMSFSPYCVTILVLYPVCAWCLCRCVHVFRCSIYPFVYRGDIFPLLHAFAFVSVESMVLFYWGVRWACRRVPSYMSTWLRCVWAFMRGIYFSAPSKCGVNAPKSNYLCILVYYLASHVTVFWWGAEGMVTFVFILKAELTSYKPFSEQKQNTITGYFRNYICWANS